MRSNPFKSLALVLLIAAGASSAFGQITNVIDWSDPWKYNQDGVLPAANWMATNYNDSAWPSGDGVLGFPQNENLVIGGVSVNTVLAAGPITYYFRTTFVLPTTNGVTLMASNLLDDGAVIYLNGREVARPGMAAGAVSNTTQAQRGGEISDAAHGVDFYSISITNARPGTNVLAVEVHQNGTASSDMIMGMRLVADLPNPPMITVQPQDTTADAGATAQFSVVATGRTPLTYRWYTNDVLVPGQSTATLTTPITTLSMNGIVYHVTVSNLFGIVTSSDAVLTVVQDVRGPVMTSATVTATNAFEIRFNENIAQPTATNTSSTNVLNYVVHVLGTTNRLPATLVQWGINISRVRVDGTFDPSSNYVVCIYNISDPRGNVTSGDCIGITGSALTNDVFSLGLQWHFTDRVTDNTLANTNWTALSFDDSEDAGWGISSGLFWSYINAPNACSPPFTEVLKGARTHYYRRKFTVSSIPAENVALVIRHVVDDGAVFYVNATEVGRFNMAAGPVDYTTIASGTVGNPPICNTLVTNVPGSLLSVGTNNIIAVEVHQQEGAPGGLDGDAAFDAALSISYRRTPVIPELHVARTYTTNAGIRATNSVVTWVGTGWAFQHAINPFGPWTNITAGIINVQGTNRYSTTVPSQGPRRFYRLKNP